MEIEFVQFPSSTSRPESVSAWTFGRWTGLAGWLEFVGCLLFGRVKYIGITKNQFTKKLLWYIYALYFKVFEETRKRKCSVQWQLAFWVFPRANYISGWFMKALVLLEKWLNESSGEYRSDAGWWNLLAAVLGWVACIHQSIGHLVEAVCLGWLRFWRWLCLPRALRVVIWAVGFAFSSADLDWDVWFE